jgi:biotin--protein ligase
MLPRSNAAAPTCGCWQAPHLTRARFPCALACAGRGGNQWTSPDGCLMFTAARRLKVPGSQAPFINYLVCLAVVRGIEDACRAWLKVCPWGARRAAGRCSTPAQPAVAAELRCTSLAPPHLPRRARSTSGCGSRRRPWPVDPGAAPTLSAPPSPRPQGAPPRVSIKWPNDIYASGLKIGGALIHTTWQGDRFSVLSGIGLNVANRQPTTCLEEAVARQAAAAAAAGAAAAGGAPGGSPDGGGGGGGGSLPAVRIPRGAVLAHVLNHLEACYDEFEASGFKGLEASYLASWMHSGQVVEVEEGAVIAPAGGVSGGSGLSGGVPGGGFGGGRVRLTIAGLSEHGFLLALDGAGGRWELTPDGNSLDMLVGLIRRKLPG